MAEVLPVRMHGDSGSSYASSGLRRSKTSHTSLLSAALQSKSGSRTDLKENSSKPSPSRTKRSRSPRDSKPSKQSSGLRRSESDPNFVSSPIKDRQPIVIYTKLPSSIDSEQNQAPPSSPQNSSPPFDHSTSTDNSPPPSVDLFHQAEDDTAVKSQPSRHVDYLSHDWLEEDIWMSWRLIVSKRREFGERSRLENASWRTWAQLKHKLSTVSPQTLNWMKDSDVTWLYGPLQTADHYTVSNPPSEPPSQLSKTDSFLRKKPILKKRSVSEVMLQKSLSTSSLVRQAATAAQAQQRRPLNQERHHSDFVSIMPVVPSVFSPAGPSGEGTDYFTSTSTSGLVTPSENKEQKHIRFDDKVEQCIAVDAKGTDFDDEDDDEDEDRYHTYLDEDNSSDDGIIMMKRTKKRRSYKPARKQLRRNSTSETKIIEKLPSTRLKYRTDSPDVPEPPSHSIVPTSPWRPSRLSPSPSIETLRPKDPSRNFLLPDDDDDNTDEEDQLWTTEVSDTGGIVDEEDILKNAYADKRHGGMRRTASGMLMPIEEDDSAVGGLVGKVLDTVNTAKDIAHVIWNVGWRR